MLLRPIRSVTWLAKAVLPAMARCLFDQYVHLHEEASLYRHAFECSLVICFNIALFLIFVNYRAVRKECLQLLRSALKRLLMDHDHVQTRAASSDFHSTIVRSVVE